MKIFFIEKEKLMAKFCDVQKFKSAYEHRVGIQFDNAIHEMEKEEFCADAVEREKIDKAIEEITGYARFHRDITHNDTERGKYLAYEKCIEILKRNIGETNE
jgi:hypothetical protein